MKTKNLGLLIAALSSTQAQTQELSSKEKTAYLKDLSSAYVDYYDQAVLLGTENQNYIKDIKNLLFNRMEQASKLECQKAKTKIDLGQCIDELLCAGKMYGNFDKKLFSLNHCE